MSHLSVRTWNGLHSCADPDSFLRGCPTLTTLLFIVLVDMGRRYKYHYEWAIIDPPAKRNLNGVSPVCR